MNRSYTVIELDDLRELGKLAAGDRDDLFLRKRKTGSMYAKRLFAVALCQGAALHFLDGMNGIKDFDVWSFYTEDVGGPFPYRRVGVVDFGNPKFGTTSNSRSFVGRNVDCIGRSLPNADPDDPVASLRTYLRNARTKSARCLAQKAVILIEPSRLLGTVVWPVGAQPDGPANRSQPVQQESNRTSAAAVSGR
jgi:hypothetical protein